MKLIWNGFSDEFRKLQVQFTGRLSHELGSGGNVRLEQANLNDTRCKHIVELIQKRFRAEHFEQIGVKGINVLEIHKIHNRSRRVAFEDIFSSMEKSHPDAIETLFHVPNNSSFRSNDLMSLAENGFASPAAGLCPIVLSNALALADLPRLQQFAFSDVGEAVGRCASTRAIQNGEAIRPGNCTMDLLHNFFIICLTFPRFSQCFQGSI